MAVQSIDQDLTVTITPGTADGTHEAAASFNIYAKITGSADTAVKFTKTGTAAGGAVVVPKTELAQFAAKFNDGDTFDVTVTGLNSDGAEGEASDVATSNAPTTTAVPAKAAAKPSAAAEFKA